MGLGSFMSSQFRKPSGWFGRVVMPRLFNYFNNRINDFAIAALDVRPSDVVCDIGFGGGYSLPRLAQRASGGKIHGVDFSEPMVLQAEHRFSELIKSGRLELRVGDVRALPYMDGSFHKIMTVNTIYFWPDPLQNLKEVRRVLKAGGKLVVAFRSRHHMERARALVQGFTLYEPDAVAALLRDAGFRDVQIQSMDQSKPLDSNLAIGTA
jgi:ubiquinone/menaquinone biosynthesis C-methylase UbiE